MNIRIMFGVLFVFLCGSYSTVYAQERSKVGHPVELFSDAVMEELERQGKISEQHLLLASLAGTWDYTAQFWVKEGAASQVSSGTATNEMLMGDRFLSSKTELLLNIGGQVIPYEGWSILGYDTASKTFTSMWIDTTRTGITHGTGRYNEKRKAIEEKGRLTHPFLNKETEYRSELVFIDEETYKRLIFITDASSKEYKALEIDLKKRQ